MVMEMDWTRMICKAESGLLACNKESADSSFGPDIVIGLLWIRELRRL
jgi:hypothetical protein